MQSLQRICSVLLAASSIAALTGCATHDRRDAAWDPKPGRSLIDVLPNWEHKPCRPIEGTCDMTRPVRHP